MAQRGGSVVSHIRLGEGNKTSGAFPSGIYSPLIPPLKADVIIAFEPAEAVRVLPFLAPGGRMLVLDRGITPVSSAVSGKKYSPPEMIAYLKAEFAQPAGNHGAQAGDGERLVIVPGEELLRKCGDSRALNVALLGIAIKRNFFPFSFAEMRKVLKDRIPPKYLDLNLKALEVGRSV
jgi:indolepyruvate ferredoxin oxidoreductase beta subunit